MSALRQAFCLLLLLVACLAGCNAKPHTPADYEHGAVQAALFVVAESEAVNLKKAIHAALKEQGCQSLGAARLANGSPAGELYEVAPYLHVGLSPERDRQVDVRFHYHRRAPAELTQWIERFTAAMEGTPDITIDLYEPPSTGPF